MVAITKPTRADLVPRVEAREVDGCLEWVAIEWNQSLTRIDYPMTDRSLNEHGIDDRNP
jgi:hypothetical protein